MLRRRPPAEDLREVLDLTEEKDEVIDLNALTWEESASLVEYDDDRLRQEMIERRQDTVAPSTAR